MTIPTMEAAAQRLLDKAPGETINEASIAHSCRFRKVSTVYPHAVALAYEGTIARAMGDSDEEVAATVAAWRAREGLEPLDYEAVGREERNGDDWPA